MQITGNPIEGVLNDSIPWLHMEEFDAYLADLDVAEAAAFRSVIQTVREHVPGAEEGLRTGCRRSAIAGGRSSVSAPTGSG